MVNVMLVAAVLAIAVTVLWLIVYNLYKDLTSLARWVEKDNSELHQRIVDLNERVWKLEEKGVPDELSV